MRFVKPLVLVSLLATGSVQRGLGQGLLPEALTQDSTLAEVAVVNQVPDSLLSARLQAVFAQIDEFEGVELTVNNGVVRLFGTALQPETRGDAADLAGRFEGVLYVDNDIEAATDVETRVTPAIAKVQDYLDAFMSQLPVIGIALLVVFFFGLISYLIGRWQTPHRHLGMNPLLWGLVRRLLRAFIFLLGLLLAFDILGIASMVGAVLGAAGVVGLALGFAFQDIVENYLAGMLLSIRQPFGVNDLVRVGEYEGRIVRLTSREVLMLSFEGNHVRLPNATVFKSPLINFSLNPRRLFHFEVGVDVEANLREAMAVGVATLAAMRGVLEDPPPFAHVRELGDSSVVVRYHGWVDQQHADFLKARSEGIRLVKAALDEADIEMPEPIYRVHLREMEAPSEAATEQARTQPSAAEQAQDVDVTPDGKLDEQVREDLARTDEENLLDKDASTARRR